ETGALALKMLGKHPFTVEQMVKAFRRHDYVGLEQLYELWDVNADIAKNRTYLARAREHSETLRDILIKDRDQLHDRSDRAWTPPPKGYTRQFED
ncbi:MAG: potassium transporter, partial [Gammaproteobacteria bacterium]|nr:potassium transporter [Gammaproteobacteria bacterium]